MFTTFPKPSRRHLNGLTGMAAGLFFAVLAPFASAQTLPEIQGLMKQGRLPQALEKVDAYIAAQPRDPQGLFTKGLILTDLGRVNDAIAVFTGLTENFPELPEPYNNLAVLYAGQRHYDQAQTALEMAIRVDPAYAVAYENLGDIYAKRASSAYDKAIQLNTAAKKARAKQTLADELVKLSTRPASGQTAVPARAATAPPSSSPARSAATAAPAVETKPLPEAAPAGDITSELTARVEEWAQALSRKDAAAYLAFYADDFRPQGSLTREQWEADRRQRMGRSGNVRVTVSKVKVSASGDTATVRFHEEYVSPGVKSSSEKTLIFVKSDGVWLIRQERAG